VLVRLDHLLGRQQKSVHHVDHTKEVLHDAVTVLSCETSVQDTQ